MAQKSLYIAEGQTDMFIRVFHETIMSCMTVLEDDGIEEKYTGRQTSAYVGSYTNGGQTSNCSWFAAHLFCRHVVFYIKNTKLPIFETQIFHNSFWINRFGAGHDAEDPDDKESHVKGEDGTDVAQEDFAAPASPGMEHLLREQMEANKKLPKNVKYNKAFDVAELCAEYLKDTPNQLFEVYLDSFKGFASLH